MRILIDTNIWIYLYVTGLTWVIREIVRLPGHEVWITGGVRRELDKPEYGGVSARTDGMFDDGTVTTADVPGQDPNGPPIYVDAEDELIAVVNETLDKDTSIISTNDDRALDLCRRLGIESLDIAQFLIWCCNHGVLGLDDAVKGFDDLVKRGMVFKITRRRFLQKIARSSASSGRRRRGRSGRR